MNEKQKNNEAIENFGAATMVLSIAFYVLFPIIISFIYGNFLLLLSYSILWIPCGIVFLIGGYFLQSATEAETNGLISEARMSKDSFQEKFRKMVEEHKVKEKKEKESE